jgi:uncharacterized protein YdaU (DUF1376 family)
MSAPNKSPAFQFYAAEFLADENVALMSNQEIGCYIKLICFCWREGSIPSDISKIARLCGEDSSAMTQLWVSIRPCFDLADGYPDRLIHKRLQAERQKQMEFKSERSLAGKRGAEARWKKGLQGDGSAIDQPLANDASSSSSSSSVNSPTESNKRSPRFNAQAHLESLDVDPKIAKDWLTLRKAKKAAPTETAIDGIMAEARKAGVSLQSALKTSCERGWQGFKAEWLTNGNARASPVKSWSDANAETIAILTGRARDHEPDDRTFDV